MFLRLREITFFILLVLSQTSFSQTSNVVIPSLIDKSDLKTTVLNNGVELNVINQTKYGFDTARWKSSIKPTVLITNNGSYLYNSKVIQSSSNNICPKGKHIASVNDFNSLCKELPSITLLKNNGYINSKPDYLWFSPSCKSSAFFHIPKGYYYGTSGSIHSQGEWSEEKNSVDTTQQFYLYDLSSSDTISVPLLSSAPIRCVYNSYSDYFQLNQNRYKELCPSSFLELTQSIRSSVQFESKLNSSVKIQLLFSFNEKGELVKRIISSDGKNVFNEQISQSTNKTLKMPYYGELKIHTTDTLEFAIIPNTKSSLKAELDLSKTSEQFRNHIKDSYFMAYLGNCKNIDAKAKYKLPNNIITFADSYYNETSSLHLKKVICPGPINALYSVIPGLGIYQFKQTGLSHRKLGGTSISLAAIGIASKAISITYYNRFRYNLDGPESAKNYQIANTSQKVFVVSSALYAGLALVDFTWTFSLGVKSKNLQHETNKELRTMHKQNLWL